MGAVPSWAILDEGQMLIVKGPMRMPEAIAEAGEGMQPVRLPMMTKAERRWRDNPEKVERKRALDREEYRRNRDKYRSKRHEKYLRNEKNEKTRSRQRELRAKNAERRREQERVRYAADQEKRRSRKRAARDRKRLAKLARDIEILKHRVETRHEHHEHDDGSD